MAAPPQFDRTQAFHRMGCKDVTLMSLLVASQHKFAPQANMHPKSSGVGSFHNTGTVVHRCAALFTHPHKDACGRQQAEENEAQGITVAGRSVALGGREISSGGTQATRSSPNQATNQPTPPPYTRMQASSICTCPSLLCLTQHIRAMGPYMTHPTSTCRPGARSRSWWGQNTRAQCRPAAMRPVKEIHSGAVAELQSASTALNTMTACNKNTCSDTPMHLCRYSSRTKEHTRGTKWTTQRQMLHSPCRPRGLW